MSDSLKENKMGTKPIAELLITMSIPMMISMLVQSMYNIVDSIFVAKLSEDALSAVSLAFPVQNLMISFGVGAGVAVNALTSRHLGEKNFERANSTAVHGIWLAGIHYVIFAIVICLLARPFYEIQAKDSPVIVEYAITYTRIIGVLGVGMFAQTMLEKILNSTGKTFFSMITQIVGAVTNMIMDPFLIFGIGPFPRLGVAGAAVATIFGQILGSVLAVFFNKYYNKEINLSFKGQKWNPDVVRSIYQVGIPSIMMPAVGSLMTFGLNKILLAFSSTAVAVFGAYFKLQSFVFMPVFGLNNGSMPLISYNYGAGKPDRIKQTIRLALVFAVSILFIGFGIFQLFPGQLLKMFSASDHMLQIGIPALKTISISFLFAGFSIISISACQALRHPTMGLIVSISRQLLVLLPAAFVLSKLGNVDLVWWAFPIAELVAIVMSITFAKYVIKTEVDPLYER